jgi:hypothetical protein
VQGYKTEIGVTVDARMKGDGDLHNENVGTYKGELVALDFGSHFTGHV